MASTNVGTIEYIARIDTNQLRTDAALTEATVGKLAANGSNHIKSMASSIASSAKVASVGILAITAAVSLFAKDVVSRVDILNNFPRVMSNMGISADSARKASKKLVDGILGLPTTLDNASLSVQRLTSKTKDVGKATDIFLALNNAVVAGAAPMVLQSNAMEQFAQSFAKGRPDMMEWRSMMSAMPAQLDQVARSMRLKSADELGEKLRDKTISMEAFAAEIVKLNGHGVGGLPTFAQQAKNATAGIGVGFVNARTAVVRGLAAIVQDIGSSKISQLITNIGKNIEVSLKAIIPYLAPIAVFVGTILTTAFIVWGVAILAATWPILALAAAVTGLYLLYQRFAPQVQLVIEKFKMLWAILAPLREFIAIQLMAALNDVRSAFTRLMVVIQPYAPQIKTVLIWVGKLALVLAGTLVAGILGVVVVGARLLGWFAQLISWIARAIQANVRFLQSVFNTFNKVRSTVENAFKSAGSWLLTAGKNIIDGLINGITSKIGAIKDTLKSVTDKIPDWKGPMSLDKKLLVKSGQAVMGGFVNGLEGTYPSVKRSLNGLTSNLAPNYASISSLGSASTGSYGSSTSSTNIGNINISNELDGRYWLQRLTNSQEARFNGLTPQGGL